MQSKETVRMISLDTSTRCTGFCCFENGEIKDFGKVKANDEEPLDEMMALIYGLLQEYKPDIVVLENTVVTRNAKVQRSLTMILGAARLWAILNHSFYFTINPSEWRKLVKKPDEILPKKREELKKWSIDKAREYYNGCSGNFDGNDDISDALLIGVAYTKMFEE